MRVSQLPIHLHRENLRGFASREAKLKMDLVSPFDTTLYLDCDTLVLRDPQFIIEDFHNSNELIRMAIDKSSPDSKAMAAHPFYKQALTDEMLDELAKGEVVDHHNKSVLFSRWRMSWSYWKDYDEPCLIFAQRKWCRVQPLDPRWNFLCNPEKKDDVLAEGIRKAGILHLCGLNKAKNYDRITRLLQSCTSFRHAAPKGAPSQSR
jgi:hypothetical protein